MTVLQDPHDKRSPGRTPCKRMPHQDGWLFHRWKDPPAPMVGGKSEHPGALRYRGAAARGRGLSAPGPPPAAGLASGVAVTGLAESIGAAAPGADLPRVGGKPALADGAHDG